MDIQCEKSRFKALDDWFITPHGRRIGAVFAAELAPVRDCLFGHHLLQLGSFGDNAWLKDLSFPKKWLVGPSPVKEKIAFCASMTALPVERNSIDCVVAPFTFELFSKVNNPLYEIDRILKPMGYVVFFGINPWSFWGLASRLGLARLFSYRSVNTHSALTLKRMILSHGYRQCLLTSFYYIPPFCNENLIHKLEFLNEMGKMVWPYPAGFYCFIAQKYDPCLVSPQPERADLYFART